MLNLIHTHDDSRTVDYRCDRRELRKFNCCCKKWGLVWSVMKKTRPF